MDTTGTIDPTVRTMGSTEADGFAAHVHTMISTSNSDAGAYDANDSRANGNFVTATDRAFAGTTTTNSVGITETRPKNKAVNFIIRAVN